MMLVLYVYPYAQILYDIKLPSLNFMPNKISHKEYIIDCGLYMNQML